MTIARFGQHLTPREREMIDALCKGERAKEIAERLCLSSKTVEAHFANARIKLGARHNGQLVYEYMTLEMCTGMYRNSNSNSNVVKVEG